MKNKVLKEAMKDISLNRCNFIFLDEIYLLIKKSIK